MEASQILHISLLDHVIVGRHADGKSRFQLSGARAPSGARPHRKPAETEKVAESPGPILFDRKVVHQQAHRPFSFPFSLRRSTLALGSPSAVPSEELWTEGGSVPPTTTKSSSRNMRRTSCSSPTARLGSGSRPSRGSWRMIRFRSRMWSILRDRKVLPHTS